MKKTFESYDELYKALTVYISSKKYGVPHISWVIADSFDLIQEMQQYCCNAELSKADNEKLVQQINALEQAAKKADEILKIEEPIPKLVWNDDEQGYIEY